MSRTPIAKYREAIDGLIWSINDISGATATEYIKMDIAPRLEARKKEVMELSAHFTQRFKTDHEVALRACDRADASIARHREKRLAYIHGPEANSALALEIAKRMGLDTSEEFNDARDAANGLLIPDRTPPEPPITVAERYEWYRNKVLAGMVEKMTPEEFDRELDNAIRRERAGQPADLPQVTPTPALKLAYSNATKH